MKQERGSWEIKQLLLCISLALDMSKIAFSISNFVSSCWQ